MSLYHTSLSFVVAAPLIFVSSEVIARQAVSEPLNEPYGTWCTAVGNAVSQPDVCGISSPEAACVAAVSILYPNDPDSLLPVINEGSRTGCDTNASLIRSRGRLWLGDPGIRQDCDINTLSGNQCTPIPRQPPEECAANGINHSAGNPIDIYTGIKREKVEDFSTADGRMLFSRTYASRSFGLYNSNGYNELGRAWSIDQIPKLNTSTMSGPVTLYLPGLRTVAIECPTSTASDCRTLRGGITGGGPSAGYLDHDDPRFNANLHSPQSTIPIVFEGGVKYIFRSELHDGQIYYVIRRAEYPGGYSIDYSSYLLVETAQNNNATVPLSPVRFVVTGWTDSYSRSIALTYDQESWSYTDGNGIVQTRQIYLGGSFIDFPSTLGRVASATMPDGSELAFSYDSGFSVNAQWEAEDRLIGVEKLSANQGPITASDTYHYEVSNQPFALTGITDATNVRYASWEYTSGGLAISSEHAGGVDRSELDYDVNVVNGVFWRINVTETNPLGRETIYGSDDYENYIVSVDGQASSNCVPDAVQFDVSSSGDRLDVIDREGRQTRTIRNDRGWNVSRTEARNTLDEVLTTLSWHPVFKLPTEIVTPDLTDARVYDTLGRITSRTLTDTSGQTSPDRVWTYAYQTGPNPTSVDGPLPGASDTSFYTWTGPNLTSITNEVGHLTQFSNHNPIGAPGRMVDANGVETIFGYDAEHKLVSIVEDAAGENATTSITYDAVDEITSITRPNGTSLLFEYDDARRLTAVENGAGERMEMVLNAAGGIVSTRFEGSGGSTDYFVQMVRDERNRIIRTVVDGGSTANAMTQITYDRESNPVQITDPRGFIWQNQFDSLDRLVRETDPLLAETEFDHVDQNDGRETVSKVTDDRGIVTTYVRNGFGEVLSEVSAEAGTATYAYDQRGLLTRRTDARGVVTDYSYDAAGRLTSQIFSGVANASGSNVSYEYDQNSFGIGQMTAVVEGFGRTEYGYDSLGFMTSETRTIDGQTYVTAYTHDASGEILQTTYPSGTIVDVTRDAAARITGVTMTDPANNTITPVLTNATYQAFGPLSGALFGDGHQLSIGYDQAFRAKTLTRFGSSGYLMDIGFTHDDSGNITAMTDAVRPDRSQSFVYDPIDRLTQGQGGYGLIEYDYNTVGDRTERSTFSGPPLAPVVETYTYDVTTASLSDVSVDGTLRREFAYAASGQVVEDKRIGDANDLSYAGHRNIDTQAWVAHSGSVPVPEGAASARLSFLSYGYGQSVSNDFDFALNDVSMTLQTGGATGGGQGTAAVTADQPADYAVTWQVGNGYAITNETIDGRSALRFAKTDPGITVAWANDSIGGTVAVTDTNGPSGFFDVSNATSFTYNYDGRTFASDTDIEVRVEFTDSVGTVSFGGFNAIASTAWSSAQSIVPVPAGAVTATLSFQSYNTAAGTAGNYSFALDNVIISVDTPVQSNPPLGFERFDFTAAADFDMAWQIGNGLVPSDVSLDGRNAVRFTKTDAGLSVGWSPDAIGGVIAASDNAGADSFVPLRSADTILFAYEGRTLAPGTSIEGRVEFLDARGERIITIDLDARGRIETVYRDGGAVADYVYDINEQRVSKLATDSFGNITDVHYHYDDQGRLISETNAATGAVVRDYVWLGLMPIATLGVDDGANPRPISYLHTDHLGRPAFATDTSGATIWDGGISTPFGIQVASLGAATQKLMFPGQYADEETGYSDNWHRTYDPALGQYLQADPIGLAGGLNRYAYVGGNPMGYVDPMGLQASEIVKCIVSPAAVDDKTAMLGHKLGGVGRCDKRTNRWYWFDKVEELKVLEYQCTFADGSTVIGLGLGRGDNGYGVETKSTGGEYFNRATNQFERRVKGNTPVGVRSFSPSDDFLDNFIPDITECSAYPGCK